MKRALIALALVFHTSLGAQTDTLRGRELQPADGIGSLIDTLIGSAGGRGSASSAAGIQKVIVSDDTEQSITLVVSYAGLDGRRLSGEIIGDRRRSLREFRPVTADLAAGSSQTELTFTFADGVPEGATIDAAYVRLTVMREDRPFPEVTRTFRLPKRFRAGIRAENVVVRLVAKPIGTAIGLGPQPSFQPPPVVGPPLAPTRPGRPAGAVVRDHRTGQRVMTAPPPRTETAPGGGVVVHGTAVKRADAPAAPRDHRGGASGGAVGTRDHRAGANPTVVAKTAPAAQTLPPSKNLQVLSQFHFGILEADKRNFNAQGPGSAAIELLESLAAEDIESDLSRVSNISLRVFPDKNPASGVFYFLPRAYHVKWDPDSGYEFRMLYAAATAEGQAGEVAMASRFDGGIDLGERQFITELVRAYATRNRLTFKDNKVTLRPLPIDGIEVSLVDELKQYKIPAERTAIAKISDVLSEIEVSWITDAITKENLQLLLLDFGLTGEVTFTPSGGELGPQQVPVRIRFSDPGTFGRFRWRRDEAWQNPTPYPARAKYLHTLVVHPTQHTPIVYSWDLGGVQVPPKGRAEIDASKVPAWVDTHAKRMWIEYATVDECTPCDQEVIADVTGGVTSVGSSQIAFHTITPLADTGAYEVDIEVRSRYFDPRNRDMQTKGPVVLNADNQDMTVGPIYAPSGGASGSGGPLFEYRIDLVLKDGSTYKGTRWVRSDSLRVLVGTSQIEQSLGSLPRPATPAPSGADTPPPAPPQPPV
jgi:hypothetical protein